MAKQEQVMYLNDKLIEWRRDFHMHPETGFKEFRTSAKIKEILDEYNIPYISDFFSTAVIAEIDSGKEGITVGVRCDIDALGLPDNKDVSYKSQNPNVCHACGHDGHTVFGLGTAIYLNEHKNSFTGKVKIVFQPAEEGPAPGGAKGVVESGKLDDVQKMIGIHCSPDFPVGSIAVRYGAMLASADNFSVKITGVGAHGAYPHQSIDPIATAMQIADGFKTMMTRELNPVKEAVLSICAFQAGNLEATNVIPSTAEFSGTMRTLDNNVRDYMIKRLKEIATGIAAVNHCECEFSAAFVTPALVNDPQLNDVFCESIKECCENGEVCLLNEPEMGYDDFARYGQICPAGYVYIGTQIPGKHIIFHHPEWDINEDALSIGVALLTTAIERLSADYQA